MKFIKKNSIAIICSIIILGVVLNIDKITNKIADSLEKNPVVVLGETNEYYKKNSYNFIQNTDNFVPLSYNDILNIYYTVTNGGIDNFTFYCPNEYKECLDDVEKISNDPEILTYINNFVHPYNGFSNVQTIMSESGEVNIKANYLYTQDEIKKINEKVDSIYKEVINDDMSDYEKIKAIHDYIIDHAKYDVDRNDNDDSKYLSYKAYGPLIEGYATCNGYTDAMAIFLEKMGIPNFKVATELMQENVSGHVWNAVYLNNKWLHLDLTWDDPVSSDGKDYLQHKYFLITTNELEKIDKDGEVQIKEHLFSTRIYSELKKNAN